MKIPDEVENLADFAQKPSDESFVDRFNERHAVVLNGTQVLILHEDDDRPRFLLPKDFHLWHADDRIKVGKQIVQASKAWIEHPRRRKFSRVVFDPRDGNPNHYNLWRGFAVEPDASMKCDLFLAHVRDNICGGDDELYLWVLGFLAHIVQRPWEKPGVSLVLRGKEGVGKGVFAYAIGHLMQHHFAVVSQACHLTGRFNAHLQQALLIFVDEGFWAGDKSGEGALKHLITDELLTIEGKHRDAMMVKNLSRLIVASNEEWVVPASLDARRWGTLDVADTRMNDRAYFSAIKEQLENGGYAGLMHHLMTFDLKNVDIHTVPKTAALREQKECSFAPHAVWWNETLKRGALRIESDTKFAETAGWPSEIAKDQLWQAYQLWMHDHNNRTRILPASMLQRWLKKNELLPGAEEFRAPRNEGRKRTIALPSLDACRKAFDTRMGQGGVWDE